MSPNVVIGLVILLLNAVQSVDDKAPLFVDDAVGIFILWSHNAETIFISFHDSHIVIVWFASVRLLIDCICHGSHCGHCGQVAHCIPCIHCGHCGQVGHVGQVGHIGHCGQ